jgi:hypothetical protein
LKNGYAVEVPNLSSPKLGVNARPINLRFREIDLDRQVGVGIVRDRLRLAGRDRLHESLVYGKSPMSDHCRRADN